MYLRFEDNSNIEFCDDRVFQERSEARPVAQVLRKRSGVEVWCFVTGVDSNGVFHPALARKVEDSGEGICYIVYGGAWGLRIKEPSCADDWSLGDAHQWGEPFLLLPSNGEDIRFV